MGLVGRWHRRSATSLRLVTVEGEQRLTSAKHPCRSEQVWHLSLKNFGEKSLRSGCRHLLNVHSESGL